MNQTSSPHAHSRTDSRCAHDLYKMSCEEFDQLHQRADGRCEICGVLPEDTQHGKLHIDHDRPRGQDAVRGLLCSPCNTRLGRDAQFVATPEALRYLTNPWHASPEGGTLRQRREDEGARRRKLSTALTSAVADYDEAIDVARENRDEAIRQAKNQGLTQADIVRATGYTRETIRRILNPQAAEAVRQAAAEHRRQRKQAS